MRQRHRVCESSLSYSSFILHPFFMDPYHTLGVHRGCTHQEAKDAFRAVAWHVHPDRGGDEQAFIQLHAAYKQILKDLERLRRNCVDKPISTPGGSTHGHAFDPTLPPFVAPRIPPSTNRPLSPRIDHNWGPELDALQDPPLRPSVPPDPNWAPELVMLDLPRRPPMPFDPSWNPELVMLDEPHRAPKRPDSTHEADSYASWLRELSDQTGRSDSFRLSGRFRVILTTILLILITFGMTLSWFFWLVPQE
jgi:DnaJ domain